MSRVKILNIILLTMAISSCGSLNPYIDRRRNPGTGDISRLYIGQSRPEAPAICFNPLLNTDEELLTMADAECKKHDAETHAVFTSRNNFSCRLLLPAVNFYKCEK